MKIKPLHPLISCICVTDKRPHMLLKSILSFDQQNYPNAELIISYPSSDSSTPQLLNQLRRFSNLRIQSIERENSYTIGAARNQAVEHCNGTFICMWDDDDLFFFTRIADQYNLLQGGGRYFQGSIIKQILLYDSLNNRTRLSVPRLWSGTLLCRKDHFMDTPCRDQDNDECEDIIEFLLTKNLLMTEGFGTYLYVYNFHGTNQSNYKSFSEAIDENYPLIDSRSASYYERYFNEVLTINAS